MKPFHPKLVEAVNEHNQTLRQPIILMQASERVFGQDILKSLLEANVSGNTQSLDLPTAQDVFYWDAPLL